MVTSLMAALLVSATPHTLVLMPFNAAQISPELMTFSSEHLAQTLNGDGFEVLTPQTIQSMLGLERQKQLMGCSDATSSCLAELSGALGADAILTGTMAKLGGTFQIDVRVINPMDGKSLAAAKAQAASESQLVAALDEAAHTLVMQLKPGAEVKQATATRGPAFWVPVIAGSACGLGGGIAVGLAVKNVNTIMTAQAEVITPDTARAQLADASLLRGVGIGALTVGAAAIIAGFIFGKPTEPTPGATVSVSVVPTSNGAFVGIQGALP